MINIEYQPEKYPLGMTPWTRVLTLCRASKSKSTYVRKSRCTMTVLLLGRNSAMSFHTISGTVLLPMWIWMRTSLQIANDDSLHSRPNVQTRAVCVFVENGYSKELESFSWFSSWGCIETEVLKQVEDESRCAFIMEHASESNVQIKFIKWKHCYQHWWINSSSSRRFLRTLISRGLEPNLGVMTGPDDLEIEYDGSGGSWSFS